MPSQERAILTRTTPEVKARSMRPNFFPEATQDRRHDDPYKMYGELLRTKLQRLLPPYASCYLEGAFAGDEQQAFEICVAAPNEYRGLIAEAAYFLGVPNPGYQTIIRNVWEHDHKWLMWQVENNRVLVRRMMETGKFEHPFSGPITVFRGAWGVSVKKASKGLSWTVSREAACLFSLAWLHAPKAVVLKATVHSSEIVFWRPAESEVVLRQDISAEVDPEPKAWADIGKRQHELNKAASMASHERLKMKFAAKRAKRSSNPPVD